ncbi:MAG: hypothetical protein LC113_13190 [Acidobacteria bacterium]|nr:hypothetical protein [Acidobacteriota bacterium]
MVEAAVVTWVNRWKETGEALSTLRTEEVWRSDVSAVFLSLTDASEAALLAYPPKPTSGLVEMQGIFRRMADK